MTTLTLLLKRAGLPRVTGRYPMALPRLGRRDLPALARDLDFRRGAEIGVWKGAFAASFCQASPKLHMLCVDPWQAYPAWLDTKNPMASPDAERIMDASYQAACARLAGLNCTILREFSANAAQSVANGSLDFVFIDANHTKEAVLEDLALWTPKVRADGFVAGHDFRVFTNKPTIHVVEAVESFTKQHAVAPWFVLSAEKTPSWLWVQA